MELNYKAMGQRIREQREELGYTREQFAEMIDITPRYCYDIETGIKRISLSTLHNIKNVLKLSTEYILYGKSTENNINSIQEMMLNCPPDKLKYAELLLKVYFMSLD